MQTKDCKVCKLSKPVEEFYLFTRKKGKQAGYQFRASACARCWNDRGAKWKKDNPEAYRKTHRKCTDAKRFGDVDRSAIWKAQSGCCAICGIQLQDPLRANLDHDHVSGRARGLLCDACNKGLGFFRDSIENLTSAIEYLKLHREPGPV